MTDSPWTDERVSLLKEMWAAGITASQCARKLPGTTRNAVIGKARRLKLAPRAERKTTNRPPPRLPANQSPYAVLFIARKPNQCAFPLWNDTTPAIDRLVCGAPSVIGVGRDGNVRLCPYCARHRAIAYGQKRERFIPRPRQSRFVGYV